MFFPFLVIQFLKYYIYLHLCFWFFYLVCIFKKIPSKRFLSITGLFLCSWFPKDGEQEYIVLGGWGCEEWRFKWNSLIFFNLTFSFVFTYFFPLFSSQLALVHVLSPFGSICFRGRSIGCVCVYLSVCVSMCVWVFGCVGTVSRCWAWLVERSPKAEWLLQATSFFFSHRDLDPRVALGGDS